MSTTIERPGFDFKVLQRRFSGRRLSTSGCSLSDKGASGKAVEAALRKDPLLAHLEWAGVRESHPDMGVWDIKVYTLVPSRKGIRIREDLAIGILGEHVLTPTLEDSPLREKLRVLLVGVMRQPGEVEVAQMHLVDFSKDPQVQKDFSAMALEFRGWRQRLGPAGALDRMGAGTPGYGKKIIAKTKGSRTFPGARRRALYVRRSVMRALLSHPCPCGTEKTA